MPTLVRVRLHLAMATLGKATALKHTNIDPLPNTDGDDKDTDSGDVCRRAVEHGRGFERKAWRSVDLLFFHRRGASAWQLFCEMQITECVIGMFRLSIKPREGDSGLSVCRIVGIVR